MAELWISGFLYIYVYRIQYTCTIGMGSKSTSEINKIYKLPVRRSQMTVKLPLNKLHTTQHNLTQSTATSIKTAAVGES